MIPLKHALPKLTIVLVSTLSTTAFANTNWDCWYSSNGDEHRTFSSINTNATIAKLSALAKCKLNSIGKECIFMQCDEILPSDDRPRQAILETSPKLEAAFKKAKIPSAADIEPDTSWKCARPEATPKDLTFKNVQGTTVEFIYSGAKDGRTVDESKALPLAQDGIKYKTAYGYDYRSVELRVLRRKLFSS